MRAGADRPEYLVRLPFRTVTAFTLLQLLILGAVYGVMWAGVAGLCFPVLIIALIPARQYLLPRVFSQRALFYLDQAEYEPAPPEAAPKQRSGGHANERASSVDVVVAASRQASEGSATHSANGGDATVVASPRQMASYRRRSTEHTMPEPRSATYQ